MREVNEKFSWNNISKLWIETAKKLTD